VVAAVVVEVWPSGQGLCAVVAGVVGILVGPAFLQGAVEPFGLAVLPGAAGFRAPVFGAEIRHGLGEVRGYVDNELRSSRDFDGSRPEVFTKELNPQHFEIDATGLRPPHLADVAGVSCRICRGCSVRHDSRLR
jgi:hypothetical protein